MNYWIAKQCTKTDNLLFAYKKTMSTVQCVGMIKETISYYIDNSSNVYMCMIDATKAFNRVNLVDMFKNCLIE